VTEAIVPASYRIVENKKFMWDGAVYPQEADAARVAETYRQSRFDVQVLAEGGEWLLFTRRQATADPAKG
jgi:hypothetical protein